MKIFWATLGGLALQFLLSAALIIFTGLCLWLIVPVAFPAAGFTFANSVGLSALLYIAKAVFK